MNAVAIGIFCVTLSGLADLLAARASRAAGPIPSLFWSLLFGWSSLLIYMFLSGNIHLLAEFENIWDPLKLGMSGLFTSIGFLIFYNGLKKSRVGLISALSSTYSLVVIAMGVVLALVHFNTHSGWGFGLVLTGSCILIAEQILATDHDNKEKSNITALMYGLPAAVFFGLGVSVAAYAIPEAQAMVVVLIARTVNVSFFGLLLLVSRTKTERIKDARAFGALAFIGVSQIIQFIVIRNSASTGQVILINSVLATTPVVASLLALFFIKEKLSRFQTGSLLFTVAGVIVLSLA